MAFLDLGGKNIEVARTQIEARGVGQRSHIAGASVHNQRIEDYGGIHSAAFATHSVL